MLTIFTTLLKNFVSLNFFARRLCVFAIAGLFAASCSELGDAGATGGTVASNGTDVRRAAPKTAEARQIASFLADAGFMAGANGADRFSVASFYRLRNTKPAWTNGSSWNADAEKVHAKLASAETEGLNPAHYLHPNLRAGLASGLDQQTMLGLDIYLTAGVLQFAKDVKHGRYGPESSSAPFPVDSLAAMLRSGYVEGYIRNLGPDTPSYQGLRNALLYPQRSLDVEQKSRVALNMERARWTQDSATAGRHIHVNVAGAELVAYNNGTPEFTMPVVVGRKTRQTPIMNDRIVNLKYSPDWGVPDTVIEKDYLPRLLKDRNYLKKRGFQAFRGGKEVDFASINFKKEGEVKRYTFRKPPGGENPLGGVRFSLTNRDAIFLHDAPGSSQFQAKHRAKSSGCVRVGDAVKLARWIHGAQGVAMTEAQVRANMRLDRPKVVSLSQSVPVALTYLTAWVNTAGELKFAPDIYGRDKELAAKMGLKL